MTLPNLIFFLFFPIHLSLIIIVSPFLPSFNPSKFLIKYFSVGLFSFQCANLIPFKKYLLEYPIANDPIPCLVQKLQVDGGVAVN